MNDTTIYIVLTGIFAALAVFIYVKKFRKPAADLTLYSDVRQTTPQGASVFSRSGVSNAFLNAVDDGLTHVFGKARQRGWTSNLTYSLYQIYVLPDCVPFGTPPVPSFPVPANDYDGTEFDVDPRPGKGKIMAAEYTIGFHPNQFIICDSRDMIYVFEVSRNAGEHCTAYHNDSEFFNATKFHGNGNAPHPFLD